MCVHSSKRKSLVGITGRSQSVASMKCTCKHTKSREGLHGNQGPRPTYTSKYLRYNAFWGQNVDGKHCKSCPLGTFVLACHIGTHGYRTSLACHIGTHGYCLPHRDSWLSAIMTRKNWENGHQDNWQLASMGLTHHSAATSGLTRATIMYLPSEG